MKSFRILLIVVAMTSITTANLFGQARVNFQATSTTPLRITDGTISSTGSILTSGSLTQILGTDSTAFFGIGPASARIELLAGTTAGTLSPIPIGAFDANLPYITNYGGTVAGFQGGISGGSVLKLPEAPAFDGSAPVFFQFRAWSIGSDNPLTFADRLLSGTGFAGSSDIILVTPTVGVELPATLFGPGPEQWQGLTLYTVVPEPTAFALLMLGALVIRSRFVWRE
jgi:hypothetical protein